MPLLAADLADILGTIRRPGDYFVSGRAELPAPGLEVEGVGPVALPLLGFQAEQLIKTAELAPYGKGEETLVDPAVRRCWQIGPERVRFTGKHWRRTLDEIVARVGDGLGLTGPVAAEFYKLLIYDRGGFFVGHRDTEKAPGMFATLVIVLPSLHEGGELIIRHQGREARLTLRPDDASEAGFAAFYADCVHEVLPADPDLQSRPRGPGPATRAPGLPARTSRGDGAARRLGPGRWRPRQAGLAARTRLHPGRTRLCHPEGRRCRGGRSAGRSRPRLGLRPAPRVADHRGKRVRRVCGRRLLAHPGAYDADTVLIPALLQLTTQPSQPAVERLRATALAHLQARIAEPLAPPAAWRREALLGCSCEDCRSLARFLADPALKSWTLRAVQYRRSHVESTILNAKPDLTCATERKGSPHSLICTKNQASFERRVAQRQKVCAYWPL